MRALIISVSIGLTLFVSQAAIAKTCTSYCKPGISKACGKGCISKWKLCRKSTTTACNGERPLTATKHYANPTHVEPTSDESKSDVIESTELTPDGVK